MPNMPYTKIDFDHFMGLFEQAQSVCKEDLGAGLMAYHMKYADGAEVLAVMNFDEGLVVRLS